MYPGVYTLLYTRECIPCYTRVVYPAHVTRVVYPAHVTRVVYARS